MDVKAISQGGQTTFEVNRSVESSPQISNVRYTEKVQIDDNQSRGNKDVSEKELKDAVGKLNKFLEDNQTHAEYEYHDKFKNDLMIRIVDNKSGEVIREVPPKKILDMVAKMLEMVGVLFDKKA